MTVTRETVACISPGINFQGRFTLTNVDARTPWLLFWVFLDSSRDLCSIHSGVIWFSFYSVLFYSLRSGPDTAIVYKVENLAADKLTDGTDGRSVSQTGRLG